LLATWFICQYIVSPQYRKMVKRRLIILSHSQVRMHGLFSVKFSSAIPVIIIYTLWFLCYVHGLLSVIFSWAISAIIIYTLWPVCYVCVCCREGLVSLCCDFFEINKASVAWAITNPYDTSIFLFTNCDDITLLLFVSSLIYVPIVSPQYRKIVSDQCVRQRRIVRWRRNTNIS
jgi:hypothetical protein